MAGNNKFAVGHFWKYHNTLCLSPQILHKHCFCFLLGPLQVPGETGNNAYAKFGGTNKEYYGIFRSGLFAQCFICHQIHKNIVSFVHLLVSAIFVHSLFLQTVCLSVNHNLPQMNEIQSRVPTCALWFFSFVAFALEGALIITINNYPAAVISYLQTLLVAVIKFLINYWRIEIIAYQISIGYLHIECLSIILLLKY